MKITDVPFSEARQRLTDIVDAVGRSGHAVRILRHGKPVAVVMNAEEYESRSRKEPFKAAGSIKFRKGIDVDKVIAEGRKRFSR